MSRHEMTSASMITCAGCKHIYADSALYCPNCGTPKARDHVTDALVGKVLGERFQVLELLGQGGSGTIYRAEHVTLRRKVAIKVLHNELSRDDLAIERFRREATTVAEIDNEHIVEIHDFGRTPDGRLYLAMELLEGETLDGILAREGTLSVERTADILIQVGEALMEAHAIGYVHRDLRPRNIYLAVRRGKANFVKLLDFGLAKLVESDAQAASTSLGMTFGDPRYMSPEQARGDRIDRRADIYQLGCIAYEMLTGAPPFTGSRVFDILSKQVTEIPAPLPTRRPGVPLWMEAAVTKMLAKDAENRFATTTRMVEALRRGLETGEVMEDEIARRRESIPPPSVSRVMQKMGIPAPVDTPVLAAPLGKDTLKGHLETLSSSEQQQLAGKQTMKGHMEGPLPVVEESRRRTGTPQVGVPIVPQPAAGSGPASTLSGPGTLPATSSGPAGAPLSGPAGAPLSGPAGAPLSGPAGAPLSGPAGAPLSGPAGAPLSGPPVIPTSPMSGSPAMPASLLGPPAMPASLSGPPAIPASLSGPPAMPAPLSGSPVMPGPVPVDTQAPVTGVIEPRFTTPAPPPDVKAPTGPVDGLPSGRRSQSRAPGDSSAWFEDGERASEEADRIRAKKLISPSTTDISLYDDTFARPRRWPLAVGALLLLGLVGGGIALAISGGDDKRAKPAEVAAPTPPPMDVPPSQIIEPSPTELPPTMMEPPPPAPVATAKVSPSEAKKAAPVRAPKATSSAKTSRDDAAARRPGGDWFSSGTPSSSGASGASGTSGTAGTAGPTTTTITAPTSTPTPTGVSGVDGPQDPYGGGEPTSPGDAAPPEKKAEFFANVGQQQLASGDAAGAAASFKKALELDAKHVPAIIGMGEIALRQGLFGDAIAHLKKAARLAPRSSRVFTLLGEAYLNSGNNSVAADNFKKALQLDPDNARAREGFEEASARVPPIEDDAP
jgi:eukaryotic-like serine/threonine-protein kinase